MREPDGAYALPRSHQACSEHWQVCRTKVPQEMLFHIRPHPLDGIELWGIWR